MDNTVEDLKTKIEQSKKKSAELRNLYQELKSKIAVENSWCRYLQHKLSELNKSENPNATK